MRDFVAIDAIISEWVEKNGLSLLSSYKETQVRSVNIVDSKNMKWQLWIEPEDDAWCIHWWNYKDTKRTLISTTNDLLKNLQTTTDTLKTGSF